MPSTDISMVVKRHAEAQPARTALISGQRRTSYAELDRRVDQVTNGLMDAGLRRQDHIAILDLNSDHFYEVWLGSARAGIVCVALNARIAAAEVASVLRDCRPRVLFVGAAYAEMIGSLRSTLDFVEKIVVTGTAFEQWRDAQSAHPPGTQADGEDVCLQLYTSGTTGVPKGVQLTNDNVRAAFEPSDRTMPSPWTSLRSTDVVLQVLPHGHVAGSGFGLAGLHNGATLVIVREFNPPELIAIIERESVTTIVMVPVMIDALMGALAARPDGGEACRSLDRIIYGAAPMATATLLRALTLFPAAGFGQLYGLTETSGPITYLSPADHRAIAAGDERLALSCGRRMPDVEVQVVDGDGNEVLPGQVGEIVCRARQVMKGYWDRDADNAAVLRGDWFHTGDIGSVDENGYFQLHDRKRDMIITGGENVYPAEVENALHGHPSVAEAAVFGVPDGKWGEAVRAAVVLKPGASVSEADLVAYLKARLAGFKVPKTIDFADSLPRNATGKILRRILREPFWKDEARHVA